jgi:cob(I)alamin adenosyltransferase
MNHEFKIYTKTGDDGTSGLIGGTRVNKYDDRLEAYGTIDELNSWIGTIISGISEYNVLKTLEMVQNNLFVIGSHLATDETKSDLKTKLPCHANDTKNLENEIDRMNEVLSPLTNFILPGGATTAGFCHIARTVCRRAERRIAALQGKVSVHQNITVFVNRLSDYLFVLARYVNHLEGVKETIWVAHKS